MYQWVSGGHSAARVRGWVLGRGANQSGHSPGDFSGSRVAQHGVGIELAEMGDPGSEPRLGGLSDDIGDIYWNASMVAMRSPRTFRAASAKL